MDLHNFKICFAGSCKILDALDKISLPSFEVKLISIGLKIIGCFSFFLEKEASESTLASILDNWEGF